MQKEEKKYIDFMLLLLAAKKDLSWQEYSTFAGQAKHGDVDAAAKGLHKLLKRKGR